MIRGKKQHARALNRDGTLKGVYAEMPKYPAVQFGHEKSTKDNFARAVKMAAEGFAREALKIADESENKH